MIDDRELTRHLEEGGEALWNRPEPPPLDLAEITGAVPASQATSPTAAPARRRGLGSLLGQRPWMLRPGPAFAGALACVAVGIAIGVGLTGDKGAASPGVQAIATTGTQPVAVPDRRVDLQPLGDAPARALAVASVYSSGDGKRVDLRITGLPPLRHGTFYEVWALGKKGRMVSLGTVSVDPRGNGETSMRLPVSLNRFPTLDVSLERADGNPAHSGHSLLRAPV